MSDPNDSFTPPKYGPFTNSVPLIGLAGVGVILLAGLITFGAFQKPPVSSDPTLSNAVGYGTYVTADRSEMFFSLSCVQATSHASEPADIYQVPTASFVFDVGVTVPATGKPVTQKLTRSGFISYARAHHWRGYVERVAGHDVATSARGTTGCAGTLK